MPILMYLLLTYEYPYVDMHIMNELSILTYICPSLYLCRKCINQSVSQLAS